MISAKTSEFKAHLAHYLGLARNGREVVVKDRDTPVARLVPYKVDATQKPLSITPKDPAAPPLGKVRVGGIKVAELDTLAMLVEDRNRR
jgi:antitoxin (DNA-binding transcriptional repressor) of toxin-antitoxin stability system